VWAADLQQDRDAAPGWTVTEAFAWLATATAIGKSVGAAAAGAIADASGSAAAFVVAGLAAVAAALTFLYASRRRRTSPLARSRPLCP
jgi:predicted MFS family arabinose efflux permease